MASAALHLSLSPSGHAPGAPRASEAPAAAARGPLSALPGWAWKPQAIMIRDKAELLARAAPQLPADPIDQVADALYEIEFEESPELAAAIVVAAVRHVVPCRGVVVTLRDLDGAFRVAASAGLRGRAELVGAALDERALAHDDGATGECIVCDDAEEVESRYGGGGHAWRFPVVTAGQVSAIVEIVDPEGAVDSPDVTALLAMVREHLGEFVAQHGGG